jgi:hypothetical protein
MDINVVEDKKNPDVLFHSIFGNSQIKYKCKKILYVAENIRYSYNQTIRNNINSAFKSAHYTITFDPETDTNYRLPLWQVFILRNPSYWDKLINRIHHLEFNRFCSFTVSNPSNELRNSHFDKLSQYKKIHSYGKVRMNTFELKKSSEGKYWRDAKDEFFIKNPHKFMMAYENTSYPYYCTEKLMDSFLAGSLPIYWGDPKVKEDWNPKAFLNMPGGALVDEIKRLDNDQEYFNAFYNEPVFTDDQKIRHLDNMAEFEGWLLNNVIK